MESFDGNRADFSNPFSIEALLPTPKDLHLNSPLSALNPEGGSSPLLLPTPELDVPQTLNQQNLLLNDDSKDFLTGIEAEIPLIDPSSLDLTERQTSTTLSPSSLSGQPPLSQLEHLGEVLVVLGDSSQSISLLFQWTEREASFNNEVGVFLVSDEQGRVNGIAPGEPGYAQAALSSPTRQVLFSKGQQAGNWRELTFFGGSRLAFYLIQNSTTQDWLATNPQNSPSQGALAFFSVEGTNPDQFDHVHTQDLGSGFWQYQWEDLTGGGDKDFDDVVFNVSQPGLQVPGEQGQTVPIQLTWVSTDAARNNEMGLFWVDDATGRIGNLLPGDSGYIAAALSSERHQVVFTKGQTAKAMTNLELPSGKFLAWYFISEGTTAQFLADNPSNQLRNAPIAFFSYPGANRDGLSHVHHRSANELTWEDLPGGGDLDFNDLVFRFEWGYPKGTPQKSALTIDDVTLEEGEATKSATFTVSLSAPSILPVTVNFTTADSTASSGEDYQATSGTLSFAPGETRKKIVVSLLGDSVDEEDENFFLNLSQATNATITDFQGIGRILDNDPPPQLSIDDVMVVEGKTAQVNAEFTVKLSGASRLPVTVDYQTVEGTAKPGEDYQAVKGTLSFAPGQTSQKIIVPVLEDILDELDEAFSLQLSNPTNATLAKSEGIGTIQDGDSDQATIVLTEGNRYLNTHERTFTIPESPSVVSFTYSDLNFDTSDADNINDAFEVALVDSEGNSLVHTIAPNRDAFFNLSEGLPAALGIGTSFDKQTVSVDLSGITPGTKATLIFRLVNNDADVTTEVVIKDIKVQAGTVTGQESSSPTASAAIASEPIDFKALEDVNASSQAVYGRTSFKSDPHVLYVDVAALNQGGYELRNRLLVAVKNLSDPTVKVRGFDGLTPEGLPYFDFTHLIDEGILSPNEATAERTLSFFNPDNIQFTYDLVFLSELNRAPELVTDSDRQVLVGQPYQDKLKATDPDNDLLTYSLLSAPEGLTIDTQTGEMNWSPDTSDVGNQAVTVEVDDGRGGFDRRTITLSVVEEIPNRPPVFTSTPVVEANINTPYLYEAQATDADGDGLTYSLLSGPAGITVKAETGLVEWSPAADQLGTHSVTLQVSDRGGGVATQTFEVLIRAEASNHAPSIISDPFTQFNLPSTSNSAKGAVSPTLIDLELPLGEVVTQTISLTLPSLSALSGFTEGQFGAPVNLTPTTVWSLSNHNGGTNNRLTWGDPAPGSFSNYVQYNNTNFSVGLDGLFNLGELAYRNGATYGSSNFDGDFPLNLALTLSQPLATTESFKFLFNIINTPNDTGDPVLDGDKLNISQSGSSSYPFRVGGIDYTLQLVGFSGDGGNTLVSLFNSPEGSTATASLYGKVTASPIALAVVGSDLVWKNLTGTVTDVKEGQTVTFTGQLTGDGKAHSFDLLLVRPDTGLVMGSIPVTINNDYLYPVKAIDADGDVLTYRLVKAPSGATIDATTGQINWEPPSTGKYDFTVQVDDARGGRDTQSYTVTVTTGTENANPVITSKAPTEAILNQPFTYTVFGNDPDGDFLSYYLDKAPEGMTLERTTGVMHWRPNSNQAGSQSVTVRVLDGRGGEAAQTFTLAVGADLENSAPSFNSTPVTVGESHQLYRYQATASDSDGDELRYDLSLAPSGMTLDGATGTIVWRPTASQAGTHTVVVRVSDGRGGLDLQAFAVEVGMPNIDPIITSTPPAPAVVALPYQYQVRAQDADGKVVSYHLDNAPDGMTINETTGVITWTPTAVQVGSASVQVSAIDEREGKASQTFKLEVVATAVNEAPMIASTPRTEVQLGSPYFYSLVASDPNADPLTTTLVKSPSGMTIDKTGRLFWIPTAAQFGKNAVTVQVDDGRGGLVQQSFMLNVVTHASNAAPKITSTPRSQNATVAQPYTYTPSATDSDGDLLLWSLKRAPVGMSIDPFGGTLHWKPTSDQIGTHEVSLQVVAPSGATFEQTFTLTVRGTNLAPRLLSTPVTTAAANQPYRYSVLAQDEAGDALTYHISQAPDGMTINASTGVIEWLPTPAQVGFAEVTVAVSDSLGAVATQTYSLSVQKTALNAAPTITSTPLFLAPVGQAYTYQVSATDPEGDSLSYQLMKAPAGMSIDAVSGLLSWSNPVAGGHSVVVGVSDGSLGAAQAFTLTALVNQLPILKSTNPPTTVTPGEVYRYDVIATDPDGSRLTFGLDSSSQQKGMTIDELGRLSWTPTNAQVGTHNIAITITDGAGASIQQAFSLKVQADAIAPKVQVVPSLQPVALGESVTLVVSATDNVGVKFLNLLVNGKAVTLDANGLYTFAPDTVGEISAIATAIDAAGNQSSTTTTFSVINKSDVTAPVIKLPSLLGKTFTAPTEILGTVTDDNLLYYTLSVAQEGTENFQEIFQGTNSVSNGVLGTFDPSLLANDAYTLRLTAVDAGGNSVTLDETVNVEGNLKLGNFQLSFTDLTIPVSGIPITVTRTYDTLTNSTKDEFGYGWRLEFRDTDLRTSLGKDKIYETFGILSKGFKEGDKVYITLPGGKREAYTFKPELDPLGAYLQAWAGGYGIDEDPGLYHPVFVSESGSHNKLTVSDVLLVRSANGQFAGLAGLLYNPVDVYFGGQYTLTTKEGIVYEIDAQTGDLLRATDPNGNQLTFSDAGITSDTGVEVKFGRDAQGRITTITDPMKNKVKYEYDAKGDLVKVTDQENNITKFEYNSTRAHYLGKIIDPLGRTRVKNEYNAEGRLSRMLDVNGKAIEMVYDLNNSVQTVKDVFGNPTTYKYDERGNILTEIDPVGKITKRTYDSDNNLLSETIVTDESGQKGWTTSYTYDTQGNKLTETDPLSHVTRYSYNKRAQVLSETDPLGNTTTYEYDFRTGNLSSTKDAAKNITKYNYDSRGNLVSLIDALGNVSQYSYDTQGNVTKVIDALGNGTTYAYDSLGNQLSETKTVTTSKGIAAVVTKKTYDSNGNLLSLTDAQNQTTRYEYDKLGKQIAVIDALNRRTEYRYDEKGQLIETIYPDSTPENLADNPKTTTVYDKGGRQKATIDRAGRVTYYNYDAVGKLIETIYPDANDTLAQFVFFIDSTKTVTNIDWTKVIYPDGNPSYLNDNPRTLTEYYQNGQVKAEINERGYRTEYVYDANNQLIKTIYPDSTPSDLSNNPKIQVEYDAIGREINNTDELGRVTRYIYDELGRLVETQYQDGTSSSTTYGSLGRPIAQTDRGGRTTQYKYDNLGRLLETIYPDSTPNDLEDNPRTRSEYDNLSRLIASVDERGNRTEYEYDTLGRQILIRDALGNETTYTYDAVGNRSSETNALERKTEFVYDEQNRLIKTQFADGTSTTNTYDALGRVIATTDQNQITTQFEYEPRGRLNAVVNALLQRTEYSYDAAGNLIKVKDANNYATTYEYDERGRRIAVILPGSQKSKNTYDAAGNVISSTNFNGEIITYIYDENNRLIVKKFTDGTQLTYTYTLTGEIATVTDNQGTTSYKYDARDRLISRTDPNGTYLVSGATIEYQYDAAGNRIEVTIPTGTTQYTYDTLNRLDTVTDAKGNITTYSYNEVSKLTKTQFPNGVLETRSYDTLNRLISLKNVRIDPVTGEEIVVSSYDYTLNAVGNRIKVEEQDGRIVEYKYDDLYRLLEEKINSDCTLNYTYDKVGNRFTKIDSVEGITTYIYNENNWLLTETQANGEVTVYQYDENGNTSKIEQGASETIYEWDKENRLVEVQTDDGDTVTYTYDTDNIRTSSTVNGVTTKYLVDKNLPYAQVLEEYVDGELEVSYVYGLDLISQQRGSEITFYQVDGLGSTRVLTDETGAVTNRYNYEAFGSLIDSNSSVENNYLFASEQFDENLEQYYLRERYYDIDTGRFTRRDSYEGSLNSPVSLHKYLYANANPVNFIDPSGNVSIQEVLAGISITDTLLNVVQFALDPTPAGVFFLLLGSLDFLPSGFVKGITKLIPENKLVSLTQGLIEGINPKRFELSQLAASRWLNQLGHIPIFGDKSLKLIAKDLTKQGIKLDTGRVVDLVAKKHGNESLLLMVEAKSGLSQTEIKNILGDATHKSKFEFTKELLQTIHDSDKPFPVIENLVITYRNTVQDKMGDYQIIDGLLYHESSPVIIDGKHVIMQQVADLFD